MPEGLTPRPSPEDILQLIFVPSTNSIRTDTEIIIEDPKITIGNVKVGSENDTVDKLHWLKTKSDGTVYIEGTVAANIEDAYKIYSESIAIDKTYPVETDLTKKATSLFFRADQAVKLVLNGGDEIPLAANEEYIKSLFKISTVKVKVTGATQILLDVSG
jgi:hypothetical protein